MTRTRWFLPDTPDVLGLLRAQLAVTIEGVDAFAAWAGGDRSAADAVRDAEQRGDTAKRALLGALRAAFVTPLEPEDVFALSRGVDWILDYSRDLVSESEAMASPPDSVIAEMARLLAEAVGYIDRAPGCLGIDDGAATGPPMQRSRSSASSSAPTTEVWPRCSRSKIAASGSPGASSTAARSGSVRP